jgi:hypothetical protein
MGVATLGLFWPPALIWAFLTPRGAAPELRNGKKFSCPWRRAISSTVGLAGARRIQPLAGRPRLSVLRNKLIVREVRISLAIAVDLLNLTAAS